VGIDGKCGIVHGGTARDVPRTFVNIGDLPAYVGQLAMQEADRG
jgi:hypothetical protein